MRSVIGGLKMLTLGKAIGLLSVLMLGAQAGAAGFEKSIMFGGRTSGVAGIATPYIQGSEALYFNPAGLATDKVGKDVSFNLSPSTSQFKGPITANDVQSTSERKLVTPGSLMYQHSINEKLGVGVGAYNSGGTKSEYTNLPFNSGASSYTNAVDLVVSEFSLGAGYKISERLKVGLGYRITMINGSLKLLQRNPSSPTQILISEYSDISGTNYMGFRLGAQYKLSDSTMLGFTYRSDAPFSASTKSKVAGTTNDNKLLGTFPDAYTLGVQHTFNANWNSLAELVWTNYSRMQNLQIQGTVGSSSSPKLELAWNDQLNVRLAGEYLGFGMPVRFGYIYTSRVTDPQFAKATFTPPGVAHTLTLGTGKNIGDSFAVNGGLAHTWASGDVTAGNSTDLVRNGTYSVAETALHLGASYSF
jgi:long-subunit fatty acid transport protein